MRGFRYSPERVAFVLRQAYEDSPFLNHSLNNIGDPFHQADYLANTHQFE